MFSRTEFDKNVTYTEKGGVVGVQNMDGDMSEMVYHAYQISYKGLKSTP